MIRIVVCATCTGDRLTAGERVSAVATAIKAAGLTDRVRIGTAECMGACAEPVALALQGAGRASYLFSGIALADDGADIGATCRAYLDSDDGWITDARPCGRLRLCLRARIPALPAEGR
ncbi:MULTISPECIES: DUF1636 family protein [unclassified Roseitalea]|uniref:DUF1636 family protein n=1 Tax=unclassified Roseitalea TaxID=2639107 RepID=UPI00273FC4BB|nr:MULTISPECIES: DUF1636 family protein [unclassified Roseitalea]